VKGCGHDHGVLHGGEVAWGLRLSGVDCPKFPSHWLVRCVACWVCSRITSAGPVQVVSQAMRYLLGTSCEVVLEKGS
jgi:hypothetical protein